MDKIFFKQIRELMKEYTDYLYSSCDNIELMSNIDDKEQFEYINRSLKMCLENIITKIKQ